jgi:hypothetical protein
LFVDKKEINYFVFFLSFLEIMMNPIERFFKIQRRLKRLIILLKYLFESQSSIRKFFIKSGVFLSLAFIFFKLIKKFARFFSKLLSKKSNETNSNNNNNTKNTPNLNGQFLKEFSYLLKIMFPKFFSRQIGLLTMHSMVLVFRTFLSIYVAKLEGALTKNIVKKDSYEFGKYLVYWLLIALPATTSNSLIKYLESKLDLSLKTELVNKSLNHYFNNRAYYKIAIKQNENLQIDQNLSEDIERLTNLFSHLYSHLTKPVLDVSTSSFKKDFF